MKLAKLMLAAGLSAILGFAAATASHALDATDLIRNNEAAEHYVSYRGLKYADISVGGRTTRAHFKIVHLKPDSTRTEYFDPKELSGIIAIEKGSDSWKYLPSTKRWQHNKWELSNEKLSLALKNYNVVSDGKQNPVAGRQAYVVKLMPKKKGNPSETIWIDAQCYITLKSELRNSSGSLISVSAFESIKIEPGNITESVFDVKSDSDSSDSTPKLGFEIVKPRYVPKGYSLAQVSNVPIGQSYAAHLMYTNGINTISVFERKRSRDNSDANMPGLGKWAHMVRFSKGKITFTIISDIDKREVQKIANSLK